MAFCAAVAVAASLSLMRKAPLVTETPGAKGAEPAAALAPVEIREQPSAVPAGRKSANRAASGLPSSARVTSPPAVRPGEFVALPSFDPAIPVDRLQMVRVELPGRALSLVGIPVSEAISEERVVADVLILQDGRPYAVRFVRNIQ